MVPNTLLRQRRCSAAACSLRRLLRSRSTARCPAPKWSAASRRVGHDLALHKVRYLRPVLQLLIRLRPVGNVIVSADCAQVHTCTSIGCAVPAVCRGMAQPPALEVSRRPCAERHQSQSEKERVYGRFWLGRHRHYARCAAPAVTKSWSPRPLAPTSFRNGEPPLQLPKAA
jgi:hypothetical protein